MISGAVNSRIAWALEESPALTTCRLQVRERAARPRRSRSSATAMRRPSTSSANRPCRPPAARDLPGWTPAGSRVNRPRFGPAGCCWPSTSVRRDPRSSPTPVRRADRAGSPAARRIRGRDPGAVADGMHVTHSGAGGGDHVAIISEHAWTSSSAKRPSSYLPCRTRPPQPASRQMQSALPTSARWSRRMFP